ncbi:MAG TPA: adenylate/guanylate cyclase domain-containing protein [Gemmatimonadota bacterium]|nr:adenylate/guanylate cyclase domain-containing protein [Gemmatimonadota bacterium]
MPQDNLGAILSSLRLRFPSDPLEREFRAGYARAAIRPARATTILVIALYVGYVALDFRTGTVATNLPVRITVVLIMSAILALTWHTVFLRTHSWILSVGALTAAGGMLVMMTLQPQHEALFYPGIGIAIIGTFALFRILFPIAVADAVIMVMGYEAMGRIYPFENLFVATCFLVTCLLLGAFAGWHIERSARLEFVARKGLEEERERSERLLLNILPQPIAERLKTEPAPIADRFPEASILFADVVGFTAMCGAMEPEDLVTFLNELFTEFDHVAERHGLEKIKTIGDAYMAVSGVPVPCPDHLERIAEAALEMRELAGRRANGSTGDGAPLAVRFGIDTGPVVAGVIGEKKFIYDLWGDPVTMASRMETQGEAGAIQVTEAVRERLEGRYALEPRGTVDIKGRGEMATWWLLGTSREVAG